MPKFFFLIIFILLSLPGFTQEEDTQKSPDGGRVIIEERPVIPETEPSPQDTAPNEDEDIREIEEDRKKHLEKIQTVEAVTKPLAEPALNPLEEIKRLGYQQIGAAALMDQKVLAIIQKTLKLGVLDQTPPAAVRTMILEKVKGSMLETLFAKFPKLLDIAVDMMRSKEALSGLLGILVRKDDLKTYGYIWLAVFLFGIFLKNRIIKPKWPFFKRFSYSMTISLIFNSITIYVFYTMFSQELAPTLSIIAKHF
jgi:hypothetical protein